MRAASDGPILGRASSCSRLAELRLTRPEISGATLAVVGAVAAGIVLTGGVWSLAPAPQVLVDSAVGVGFPVIAGLISLAEVTPGVRLLGRVMLVSGVAAALAGLCTALALVLPAEAASTAFLVQLQSWLWVPAFAPLLLVLPHLYPDGRLLWRPLGLSGIAGTAVLTLAVALHDTRFEGQVVV